MPDQVTDLAFRLLEKPLDPIPRYRLMRDVLFWPADHDDIQLAKSLAMSSRQVADLCRSQLPDGSWGRFYTRNKQVKYAGKTTETAIIRSLVLGMERSHPTVSRLIAYMEAVLGGSLIWPDRPDQTLEWPVGMDLVTAARLSQLDETNPGIQKTADQWQQIMAAAFGHDEFDELSYREAYENFFHQPPEHGTALGFSPYTLILLRNRLPYLLEERLTNHLMNNTRGIYLVSNHSLQHLPLVFPSRESMRFIAALDLLSYYPSAGSLLENASAWLWEQINNDGMWDFGQLGRDGLELPLSESWRIRGNRELDCTVRVLSLVVRLQRTCEIRRTICHNI